MYGTKHLKLTSQKNLKDDSCYCCVCKIRYAQNFETIFMQLSNYYAHKIVVDVFAM